MKHKAYGDGKTYVTEFRWTPEEQKTMNRILHKGFTLVELWIEQQIISQQISVGGQVKELERLRQSRERE